MAGSSEKTLKGVECVSSMPSDEGGGGGEGDKATIDFYLELDEDNGVRKRGGGGGEGEQGGGGGEILKFYVFSLTSFRLQ